ncbi:uncharacterized protein V6R79_008382 [Siganus canaliculatus]
MKSDGRNGKRISTELWKKQREEGGKRSNMQSVEAPVRDHGAGKDDRRAQ